MQRTNLIGTGTRNITINVPTDWADEIKNSARRAGVGIGRYLRPKIEAGIQMDDAACALKLRDIRQKYYGPVMIFIFVAFLFTSCK